MTKNSFVVEVTFKITSYKVYCMTSTNMMYTRVCSWLKQGYQRLLSRNLLNIAASNLKMGFLPENVWMAVLWSLVFFFFFFLIIVLSVCLNMGISKFTALTPSYLGLHTFLQRISTSGVKIRPALKKWWYIYIYIYIYISP